MRGYGRDEAEKYGDDEYAEDQYEDESEADEYEDVEYEEEEERKPTKEELEYLALRQRLKESIRKNLKKEGGSNLQERKKFPVDNYGSFFGPSQPVIAQRVIEESKSFLENPNLVSRLSNSRLADKKTSVSSRAATAPKNEVHKQPKVFNEVKRKVETLKHTRDYSFLLSEDAELPAPEKKPARANVSVQRFEARSAQVPMESRRPLGNGGRKPHTDHYDRKPVSADGQTRSKSYNSAAANKPNLISKDSRKHLVGNNGIGPGRPSGPKGLSASVDFRKQLGSNNGVGPGRPVGPKGLSASVDFRKQLGSNNGVGPGRPVGPKGLTSRYPAATVVKKVPAPAPAPASAVKNPRSGSHKLLPPSRSLSTATVKHLGDRKGIQVPNKCKMPLKQNEPSRPKVNNQHRPNQLHMTAKETRPKKKPIRRFDEEDDPQKALSMIRKMFHTERFAGRDDNDSDMEANFEDIMREEKRSARIGRKEDEEQLLLIEEEERREQMRKKRKLTNR